MPMNHQISRRQFLGVATGAFVFSQFPGSWLQAQTAAAPASVVDFIHNEIVTGSFPGAGLLVFQRGKLVLEHFEGTYCSSTVRDNPMKRDVTHMLYSFSKGVSATLVAIARQKKLIDFDAPLSTYIPGYKGEWKDETTIRHLLTHTAGIPNVPLGAVYTEEAWQQAVETCCAAKVEWKPGSRSEYHARSAMFLAAEAVRSRIAGRPSWESIAREWLLDPIGATTLSFVIPTTGAVSITPQPKELPKPLTPATVGMAGQPGGGAFGKLDDMIKVLQLHLNGGTWEGKVILERESWAEMHRIPYRQQILQAQAENRKPDHEPFGLGWKLKLNQKGDGFGVGDKTPEGTFGHAGIWTLMGMGFPQKQGALAFISTNPPTLPNLGRIRNGITDRVYDSLA